jgi:hypothetical protein
MRNQHTSLVRGRIQRAVFDELPTASRSGPGITVREIAERTGLGERQIRGALWRLNRQQLAFCFDKDERHAGVWERARSEPCRPPPT